MAGIVSHLVSTQEVVSLYLFIYLFIHSFIYLFLFFLFRATPMTYGGSQARGPIGATAASLCQSHSNVGSEPGLRPTPQVTAMLDPQPTEQGQGLNPQPHGS